MTTMLPLQMVSIRTLGIGDPEKRLMAAVLKDAIQMYQALAGRPTPGLRMHLRQLEDWFASEDVVYPFAFRRICEALWKLTTAPGAVAIVGMLEHERRRIVATRVEVRLTERETAVFHRAQTSL